MPDIDIDFCVRGRGDVIAHVTEFYRQESVCQIITFGTMASRAAIKDVGRALEYALRRCRKDRQADSAAGPRAKREYFAGDRDRFRS